MKTALVEQWERRLKEYEEMREQMRLSHGGGGTGTVADVARINELRRCIRELKESVAHNDSR